MPYRNTKSSNKLHPKQRGHDMNVHITLNRMRMAFIAVAIALMVIAHVSGYSYVFDCEGPTGETIQIELERENKDNERAYDRCRENDKEDKPSSERDRERAETYIKENVV